MGSDIRAIISVETNYSVKNYNKPMVISLAFMAVEKTGKPVTKLMLFLSCFLLKFVSLDWSLCWSEKADSPRSQLQLQHLQVRNRGGEREKETLASIKAETKEDTETKIMTEWTGWKIPANHQRGYVMQRADITQNKLWLDKIVWGYSRKTI